MTSTFLRKQIRTQFVMVPNATARDSRLSFRAVGVLTHILSLRDGEPVSAAILAPTHSEGRDAIAKALQELTDAGYYRTERSRDAGGAIRTKVTVSNVPMVPDADFQESPEPDYQGPVSRMSVNQCSKEEEPLPTVETEKNNREEHLAALADFKSIYPARHGKRVGINGDLVRDRFIAVWAKEPVAIMRAVKNYARACHDGTTIAKDPERFFVRAFWAEWVDDDAPDPELEEAFAELFRLWRRPTPEAPARSAFLMAIAAGASVDDDLVPGFRTWNRYWRDQGTAEDKIPSLTTWLNEKRWTVPPPSTAQGVF